jgi:LacI family transcriptional regulator
MIRRRITIRDIARETGLHFTTVSLALRNSSRLKEATRLKIQKLAKEMGYVPDPMLAALNAYRQTKVLPQYQATIAWINNWNNRDHLLLVPEFREYYEGASERARERGYILEEFWLKEKGMTPKILSQIFRARNIQGVLIAPQNPAQELIPFVYDEMSAIALGYSMRPASLHVVTNHHAHTLALLLDHVAELGYKRAGLYIHSSWDAKVEYAWLGGAMLWESQNPGRMAICRTNESMGSEALGKWIREEKIDVIVSTEGIIMDQIKELGVKMPDDVGYADIALMRNDTHLSGVYQNDTSIGHKAIDLIIDMIHRGERGIPTVPTRILVESTWRDGQTLRRQTSSAKKKAVAHAH